MWDDLVVLMADGVRTGRIDTVHVRAHPGGDGPRLPRVDDHGGEVYVYRRARPAVPRLRHHASAPTVLAGRNLFWCPRCQPQFRSPGRAS